MCYIFCVIYVRGMLFECYVVCVGYFHPIMCVGWKAAWSQHMLTRVHHGDAAGLNNVEWDAIELPSQFMENWCYAQDWTCGHHHLIRQFGDPGWVPPAMRQKKNWAQISPQPPPGLPLGGSRLCT